MMKLKTHSAIYATAINFLEGHQAADLSAADQFLLVKQCMELISASYAYYCSAKYARDTALQALSQIKSRHLGEYIDMTCSTSHTLFVKHEITKRDCVIPLADLIAYLPHIDLISQLERSGGEPLLEKQSFF